MKMNVDASCTKYVYTYVDVHTHTISTVPRPKIGEKSLLDFFHVVWVRGGREGETTVGHI